MLLSEGQWFDSPGPRSVLGQDTEPQTAPDVLIGTLHGGYHYQCMNYSRLLWTKASAKYCKCSWQLTGGSCSLRDHGKTGPPLNRVPCPDWIKWAGIPENVFTHLLHEQRKERHGLLTKHWNIELFNTFF